MATASAQVERRILASLEGEIPPVRISFVYRLALIAVTVVMLLLPVVYIAIVGLVGWGVYHHATADIDWLRGSGMRARLLVYVAPLIVGVVLLVFLLKPLFAKPAVAASPISIDRRREPFLFAFVEQTCRLVKAPVPSRIDLVLDVNAAASFKGGLRGMFGNDLVLTIGLPLVAGMPLCHLTGILAHELGHFGQGTGMRLSFVIRHVSHWFKRVAFERDEWDAALIRMSEDSPHLAITLVVLLSRAAVWVTRRILWLLSLLGDIVSSFASRQMEFDADRYEVHVAGSQAYGRTVLLLNELTLARGAVFAELGESLDEGRLADDVPTLVAVRASMLPPQARAAVAKHVREATTGLLDSHPADRARIEAAQALGARGMFHAEEPSAVLFRDFEGACREVSRAFYEEALGTRFQPRLLVPTASLVAQSAERSGALDAATEWACGVRSPLLPVFLGAARIGPPADPGAALRSLREAHGAAHQGGALARKAYARVEKVDDDALAATAASSLLEAGFRLDAAAFRLPTPDAAGVERAALRATQRRQEILAETAGFRESLRARIVASLELLHHPEVQARIEGAPRLLEETLRLLPALHALETEWPRLEDLRAQGVSIAGLLSNFEGHEEDEQVLGALRGLAQATRAQLRSVRDALDAVPHPFEHGEGDVQLGEFVVPSVPEAGDVVSLHDAARGAPNRAVGVVERVFAGLAATSRRVETACGLGGAAGER